MKILRHTGALSFEASGDTDKLLFEDLAKIDAKQEVFGHTTCGVCGGGDVKFSVRTVNDNNYYEAVCKSTLTDGRTCWAKLRFGQKKKGGELFPKRKDKSGGWLKNGGWERWAKGQEPVDDINE